MALGTLPAGLKTPSVGVVDILTDVAPAPMSDGRLLGYGIGRSRSSGSLASYRSLIAIDPATHDVEILVELGSVAGDVPGTKVLIHQDKAFYLDTIDDGGLNEISLRRSSLDGADTDELAEFDKLSETAPVLGVTGIDDMLYGASATGGANSKGAIYAIDNTDKSYSVVHDFDGTGGEAPSSLLLLTSDDSLVGVTAAGGAGGAGVLFRFTPGGSYEVLAEFDGSGVEHQGGVLTEGSDGCIYGVGIDGSPHGADGGKVFRWCSGDIEALGDLDGLTGFGTVHPELLEVE